MSTRPFPQSLHGPVRRLQAELERLEQSVPPATVPHAAARLSSLSRELVRRMLAGLRARGPEAKLRAYRRALRNTLAISRLLQDPDAGLPFPTAQRRRLIRDTQRLNTGLFRLLRSHPPVPRRGFKA